MVTDNGTYKQADNKDRNKAYWATHDPIRIDLIFAQRTFCCFSATAQVAHLVLPDTQPNVKNQKSHFFTNAQRSINIISNYIMNKRNNLFKLLLLLTIVMLLFNSETSYAQTTNFYGTNKVQSNGYTGALYEVKIDRDRDLTFVTIQQIPTKNLKRLTSASPSSNAKIKSGNFEARYIGALQSDGNRKLYDCTDRMGWNNVKTGEKYNETFVFNGAIPPGLTDFSLIDEGSYSGCRGYGFSNYKLNNPDNHPKTA